MIALLLIAIRAMLRNQRLPALLSKTVRTAASCTFAMYLFHKPILMLVGATSASLELNLAITFLVVILLAPWSEGAKHWWRAQIGQFLRIDHPSPEDHSSSLKGER